MTSFATTTQILAAYTALNDDELLALRCYGLCHLGGTGFTEPLDLIHEALCRSLEGRRNWPLHVNFGLYVALSMRSIADGERKRHENSKRSFMSFDEAVAMAPETFASMPSLEEEFIAMEQFNIAAKAASTARMALAGDRDAQRVLDGLLAGMSPKEMCQSFGLDSKAFDAARHRIVRRIRGGKSAR